MFCFVFNLSSSACDRWGQRGASSSSHRPVVLSPPDVHLVSPGVLLYVVVPHGEVPGPEEQLQLHVDAVAMHGEALARQAQAGWKQREEPVRVCSCLQQGPEL